MKQNIIFLGCTSAYGYDFSATNTKTEFLAKGALAQGDECTIINSVVGIEQVKKRTVIHKENVCDVISYSKKGNQLISWIKNVELLKKDLLDRFNSNCLNVIVLESPDYHIYLLYCYYARKYGYKIVVISHEWIPTVKDIHPLRKPSYFLYTKTFGSYVDAILPISEFIIRKINKFDKPYLKVPALASFDKYETVESLDRDYFLYCVYAATYAREIFPIIDAHAEYSTKNESYIKLVLVLGGTDNQVKVIYDYIDKLNMRQKVIIKRKVPYEELLGLYRNAAGLIIPLNPNSEQDIARFPQKIAEYCSSASPIISTNVGEVEFYFEDKKNAVLCDYSKEGFISAFNWISTHKIEAQKIGKAGFELGDKYFNYRELGRQIHEFYDKI